MKKQNKIHDSSKYKFVSGSFYESYKAAKGLLNKCLVALNEVTAFLQSMD